MSKKKPGIARLFILNQDGSAATAPVAERRSDSSLSLKIS